MHGFSMVEVLVALLLTTVGALALATTFVGAASLTRQVANRQKATAYAQQQINRMKSLDYLDVGLAEDQKSLADSDWSQVYCPLKKTVAGVEQPACATNVIKTLANTTSLKRNDPREAKIAAQTLSGNKRFNVHGSPSVRRNGILLYTYVYWNNWKSPETTSQQYKIVTVVARYSDPKQGLAAEDASRYTSVKVTSIIADVPQIGQVK